MNLGRPQPEAMAVRPKVAEEVSALRQHTEKQLSVLSVLDEMRAQPRHHRAWRAGLTALLLFAVPAALWFSPSSRPSRAGGLPVRAMPWVEQTGAVTGYIQPCQGLPFPLHASTGARLFSAAATVEALSGQEYLKPAGDGTYRVVLPTVVAERERVSQNQKFRLDHLAPGRYVILAQYTGGNVSTSLDVAVAPGKVAEVDLPNTCK
jgi:hypothetical protein